MVNTELRRGGAARIAHTLAEALRAQGVDIQLFHAQDREHDGYIHGLKRPLSRPMNAFLARIGGATWVLDQGFSSEVVELTADTDILHVHNLHGYYLDFERLLTAWANRPIVWTWHDMWGATGRCGVALDCNRWLSECGQCPKKGYYPRAWMDNSRSEHHRKSSLYSQLRNLTIVCPSNWLREVALARGFHPHQVHCVPNPVDIDTYVPMDKSAARASLGLDPVGQYLLFVASDCNDPRKGYKDFKALVNRGEWGGVVVGKPPRDREDQIVYGGQIADKSLLAKYYSAADAYVTTSEADNFPTTVLEAYSCGTPVFGYAVGGIPSQVMAPPDRFLVALHEVSGLANLISDYLSSSSDEDRKSLRKQATAKWAPDAVAKRYKQIYEGIAQ